MYKKSILQIIAAIFIFTLFTINLSIVVDEEFNISLNKEVNAQSTDCPSWSINDDYVGLGCIDSNGLCYQIPDFGSCTHYNFVGTPEIIIEAPRESEIDEP